MHQILDFEVPARSISSHLQGGVNGVHQILDFERVNGRHSRPRRRGFRGLGRAGQLEAEEIHGVVKRVGTLLENGASEQPIADALRRVTADAGGAKARAGSGPLILANTCLPQRRGAARSPRPRRPPRSCAPALIPDAPS